MFTAFALLSALLAGQATPGSIADQASRPLWTLADGADLLAAVDRPPAAATPTEAVNANFWIFQAEQDGVDTIAAAITVDCTARTVVHHSFSGYAGATFIGSAAATDVAAQAAVPGTVYGLMVAHLCDPHAEALNAADFADFRAAQAARAETARSEADGAR